MKTPPLIVGIVLANLLLVLLVVNGAIVKKQAVVDEGRTVFLELAPVDPRSLMQGDYMILNYALSRGRSSRDVATRGTLRLTLDERGIGTFKEFEDDAAKDQALAENEVRLSYRKWRRGLRFGIESFFFQEGLADEFSGAKYAEARVSEKGEAVLVGLRDKDLLPLGGNADLDVDLDEP